MVWWSVVIILLVIGALLVLLQPLVLGPISGLSRAAAAAADGQAVVAVPVKSGDEIGQLASAFNTMIAQSQGRARAQREHRARDRRPDGRRRPGRRRDLHERAGRAAHRTPARGCRRQARLPRADELRRVPGRLRPAAAGQDRAGRRHRGAHDPHPRRAGRADARHLLADPGRRRQPARRDRHLPGRLRAAQGRAQAREQDILDRVGHPRRRRPDVHRRPGEDRDLRERGRGGARRLLPRGDRRAQVPRDLPGGGLPRGLPLLPRPAHRDLPRHRARGDQPAAGEPGRAGQRRRAALRREGQRRFPRDPARRHGREEEPDEPRRGHQARPGRLDPDPQHRRRDPLEHRGAEEEHLRAVLLGQGGRDHDRGARHHLAADRGEGREGRALGGRSRSRSPGRARARCARRWRRCS